MSAFSISEGMLNNISKNLKKSTELEAKEGFKVQYISIDNIYRNKKNFYEIVDIDDLAEDIKLNGLNHNLVVRECENDTFELISGERRFTALSKLVKEGLPQFKTVPCKVLNVNDIDAEIILIQANAQTRELSDTEKLKQVERLKELYKTKKSNGEKIPGKVRELIAKDLKLSPTQVGRYERINNKLISELKEILEQGNLTVANASEFSTLSEENQRVILDIVKNNVELSKNEAIELKNKLKTIEEDKAREISLQTGRISTLASENDKLKQMLNDYENKPSKSDEEIKQIEGQLKLEIEEKLNKEYEIKITEIKNETMEVIEEKKRLKKELAELKASTPKDDMENFKENLILINELKAIQKSMVNLKSQYKNMKSKDISIDTSIKGIIKLIQYELPTLQYISHDCE